MPKKLKSPEEKKKPSDYEYHRISIQIDPILKKEWEDYAISQNQTLSSVIREAMQLLIKTNKQDNSSANINDQKIDDMRQALEEKFAEFTAHFTKLIPEADYEESTKDKLKVKILDVLDQHPQGMKPKALALQCKIDEVKLLQILSEMQVLGLVQTQKGFIVKE